jgi:hypothetical protein
MENELIIPADLQARAMVDGWSQQQLNEEAMKLEINNAPAPVADPVIDTATPTITQDELQQMASGGEPPVNIEPQPPVAPSLNLEEFGVSSYDELKDIVKKAKEYEPLVQKYKEYDPIMPYLNDVQNPFANDTINRLNNFVKSTGISDLSIASTILAADTESLKSNPVKALAIMEVLNDPDLESIGFDKVMEYVAAKNNLDTDTTFDDLNEMPVAVRVELQKTLKSIENKRKEFDNKQDYFGYLQSQRTQQEQVMAQRMATWDNVLNDMGTKMKSVPVKVNLEGMGEITVDYAVSKEDLQKFIPEIRGVISQLNPDEDGVSTAMKVLENRVWLENKTQIMQQVLKSAEGKIREAQVQKVHNGGAIVNRTDAPASGPRVSPHLEATKAALGIK